MRIVLRQKRYVVCKIVKADFVVCSIELYWFRFLLGWCFLGMSWFMLFRDFRII